MKTLIIPLTALTLAMFFGEWLPHQPDIALADGQDEIAAKRLNRKLRVGVYENPPIVMESKEGGYAGIAIDVLQDIARTNNWQLEFVPSSFAEMLNRVERGEVDIGTGVAHTKQRARRFNFSQSNLFENWAIVFRNPDVALPTLFDLAGKRVALVAGDVHAEALQSLMDQYLTDYTPLEVPDYKTAMELVDSGQADAAVVNRIFSLLMGRHHRAISTLLIFNRIQIHYIFPKTGDQALKGVIDSHIVNMRQDPLSSLNRSLSRWLKPDLGFRLPSWAYPALGITLLVALATALFVIFLRHQVAQRTRALESALNDARRAQEDKGRFLTNISRSLRAPLSRLAELAEMTAEIKNPAALQINMSRLEKSAQDLCHTVDDLIHLSTDQRSSFASSHRIFDFFNLLVEVHSEIVGALAQRAKNLQLNCEDDISIVCHDDELRLRQLLHLVAEVFYLEMDALTDSLSTPQGDQQQHLCAQRVRDEGVHSWIHIRFQSAPAPIPATGSAANTDSPGAGSRPNTPFSERHLVLHEIIQLLAESFAGKARMNRPGEAPQIEVELRVARDPDFSASSTSERSLTLDGFGV